MKTTEIIRLETLVLVKMYVAFLCVMMEGSLHFVVMKKALVLTV